MILTNAVAMIILLVVVVLILMMNFVMMVYIMTMVMMIVLLITARDPNKQKFEVGEEILQSLRPLCILIELQLHRHPPDLIACKLRVSNIPDMNEIIVKNKCVNDTIMLMSKEDNIDDDDDDNDSGKQQQQ